MADNKTWGETPGPAREPERPTDEHTGPMVRITVSLHTGFYDVTAPLDDHSVLLMEDYPGLRVKVPGKTVLFAPGEWRQCATQMLP